MSFQLFENGDPDMPSWLSDYFCSTRDRPENWIGVAAAENTEVARAFFDALADRLRTRDVFVHWICDGEEIGMFIGIETWNDPTFQNTWKEIICIPKEQLIESANIDGRVEYDMLCEEWAEKDTADKMFRLISLGIRDLSLGILTDMPEAAVEGEIQEQIKSLLS